eukprot:1183683-Prorocentrum_minimum.AAC.2
MQGGTATDAAEPEEGSGEPVGGGAVVAAVHDTTGSPSRTVSAEGATPHGQTDGGGRRCKHQACTKSVGLYCYFCPDSEMFAIVAYRGPVSSNISNQLKASHLSAQLMEEGGAASIRAAPSQQLLLSQQQAAHLTVKLMAVANTVSTRVAPSHLKAAHLSV